MLEDFIETNRLSALIVPAKRTAPPNGISGNGIQSKPVIRQNSKNRISCDLFLADNEPILVVHFSACSLSEQKIRDALSGALLTIPSDKKVLEITGYHNGFLPPISIYGVRVLLDAALISAKTLSCAVSETQFLEISAHEIQEQNDDCIVGTFTR